MWQNQGGNSTISEYSGGFMKSPITPSQSTQADKGKKIRAQNLVPMTVYQIQNNLSADDVLRIGSREVNMVVIIGLVRAVEQKMTHVVYEIDDMTGPWMKVQHWFDEEADDSKKPMVLNSYVKVTGTVKSMHGQSHIVVFNIQPIKDLNEMTLHYLQVMQAKRPLPSPSEIKAMKSENSNMDLDISTSNGFTQIQSMVYKAIGEFDSMSGCSLDTVSKNLPNVSMSAIKDAVVFLNNEGHVYSTIDENHYRVTDGAT